MWKSRKLLVGISTIVLVVIVVLYNLNTTKPLYGNDDESIIKVIGSIKGYENKKVELIDIKETINSKVVGFLANNSPAIIQFTKNEKGNFKWSTIEVRDNTSFTMFLPNNRDNQKFQMMIVTNNENDIAKFQVNVNGKLIEQTLTINQASVTWIDLPQSNDKSYEFRHYKYYDIDGKELMK